jgi:lipopolysaccharide transport system ATP-binding protein
MDSQMSSDLGRPIAIEASGLGKTYKLYRHPSDRLWQFLWPGRSDWCERFVALEGVSFKLRRGEVMGIVGVNGAGKSTLLQLITGTIPPTSGTVQTKGRIAAILELGSGFNPDFTGRENVYLNAATLGLTKSEIDARMDAIIDFAGVRSHIDQPVKTYSSGMQIRLAFSIATSVDPDILIIDEALSVGDGAFGRQSFDRIMEIKERGTTILFCSHVLFHVETFCDRAIWIHKGRVQRMGEVSEVLRPYQEFIDALTDDPSAQPEQAQDAAPSAERHMEEQMASGPKGTARIRSVEVRLDGVAGTELLGVSQHSRLEVDIRFSSDPHMGVPSTAVVISSESGKILGSTLSLAQGVVAERSADGEGIGRWVMDRVPLNRGRYRIGVYLLCERGIHAYEMAEPAAMLTLTHEGVEQGHLLLQGTWSAS